MRLVAQHCAVVHLDQVSIVQVLGTLMRLQATQVYLALVMAVIVAKLLHIIEHHQLLVPTFV